MTRISRAGRHPVVVCALVLLAVVLNGCARAPQPGHIADLAAVPQNPVRYADRTTWEGPPGLDRSGAKLAGAYTAKHYLPWTTQGALHSRDELYWGVEEFAGRTLFAAQGLPYPEGWFTSLAANADKEGFPSLDRSGITVNITDVRVLPTREPVFTDPDQAGQGYPFDMMQNSVLWTGTPVHVVHRSVDRAWLLVETSWVSGWVRAQDVAWVGPKQEERMTSAPLVAVTAERVPLTGPEGTFCSTACIGSLLPIQAKTEEGWQVMIPARGANGRLDIQSGMVPAQDARRFPVQLSAHNVARVAEEMIGQLYGWGGLHARRDCSASIRDLFVPFGLWMPRNSSRQAQAGQKIDLSGLGPRAKEERIMDLGVPFATLLWKPGHIMLYIGEHRGRPVIWHTMWGVATRSWWSGEGRHVVGRTVITSLRPGKELGSLDRPGGLLINGIERMILLPPAGRCK